MWLVHTDQWGVFTVLCRWPGAVLGGGRGRLPTLGCTEEPAGCGWRLGFPDAR